MSLELSVKKTNGQDAGTVSVSEAVFGCEPNVHVMNLAVLRELANARAGTANTKTKSEVRGGGRKPWKQKGTGRARAGSIRSPLWRGGGVIFGPKPRSYAFDLPKKVRRLAIRSALSIAASKLVVVENWDAMSTPKTKAFIAVLTSLGYKPGQKVLILEDFRTEANKPVALSARNIPNVVLRLPTNLSARELIEAELVVATKATIEALNERVAAHVS